MKRLIVWFASVAVLIGGLAVYAYATVTANSIVTAQTPSRGILQFLNASTPNTYGTVYTAGANGSKCNALWVDNNDITQTHIVACQIVNAATKYGGFSGTTALSATTTAFTQLSLMPTGATVGSDSDGNPFIELNSGDTLQCTFQSTITSPSQVDFHSHCGDF